MKFYFLIILDDPFSSPFQDDPFSLQEFLEFIGSYLWKLNNDLELVPGAHFLHNFPRKLLLHDILSTDQVLILDDRYFSRY